MISEADNRLARMQAIEADPIYQELIQEKLSEVLRVLEICRHRTIDEVARHIETFSSKQNLRKRILSILGDECLGKVIRDIMTRKSIANGPRKNAEVAQ
jgi:hypothetical protein